MAVKKKGEYRVPNPSPSPSRTLMGNQDTRHKGDSTARKKDKCVTFWVTDEQKRAMSAYAAEHDMSVSRLIIEGLELRMSK